MNLKLQGNTDLKRELDHHAQFLKMAKSHKHKSSGHSGHSHHSGHSGDGSGAKFVKWMQDDMAAWPEKTGADQRDVQSFSDELWGLSKEIERVEGELKSLKENHKDLSDKKKHAEEYPAHIDIRNFNYTCTKQYWNC